jgi:ABC-type Fe3+/spermidine/putrescine transport system ATPase subunit
MYDGRNGINIPAEERGLSMVFQSYAIWPHMSVFENVAYGLRVRRARAADLRDKVHAALELVQMGSFADRPASQLSGGQQQRVALARACAFSPSVLLFDEPLSNLDAKLRGDMRIELRELQRRLGLTSLYVTHDLEEALAMSDRIVVMRAGRIEQTGSPGDIYNYPRTDFVADFVGSSNLITGRLRPDLSGAGLLALEVAGGDVLYGVAHARMPGPQPTMSVRTVHLHLYRERPAAERNVWRVVVRRAVFLGDLTQVHVVWGERELVVRHTNVDFRAGEEVFLHADPSQCVLLEASGPEAAT